MLRACPSVPTGQKKRVTLGVGQGEAMSSEPVIWYCIVVAHSACRRKVTAENVLAIRVLRIVLKIEFCYNIN